MSQNDACYSQVAPKTELYWEFNSLLCSVLYATAKYIRCTPYFDALFVADIISLVRRVVLRNEQLSRNVFDCIKQPSLISTPLDLGG